MASAGTLLSDLGEGGSGGGDGDLVQKILQDMSIPTPPPTGRQPPPPMPQQQPAYQQQMATSTQGLAMDSRIPTSHIIGNEHPTPADFAAAMVGMGSDRQMMGQMGQMPMGQMGTAMPGTYMQQPMYQPPQKNFYSRVLDEIKVPFVVALLFFVFSLAPIRVLAAHYIPSFIKPTGEFTLVGLGVVSSVVGLMFWILQRVIAPLLSL